MTADEVSFIPAGAWRPTAEELGLPPDPPGYEPGPPMVVESVDVESGTVTFGAYDPIAAMADLACGMESMRAKNGREPVTLDVPPDLYDTLAAKFTPLRRVEMRAPFAGQHIVTVAVAGPPVIEDSSGLWFPVVGPRVADYLKRKASRAARMARKRRRGYP